MRITEIVRAQRGKIVPVNGVVVQMLQQKAMCLSKLEYREAWGKLNTNTWMK